MARRMIAAATISLLLALLLSGFSQSGKSYTADRFDVRIDVQPDGALIVNETVVFRFVGGPFTYAFRDLAFMELDEIDRLQAGMDGEALTQGTSPGQVEIQAGRPLQVTWHFEPLTDTTREFSLQYRVQGAIRQLDADTLIWRAVPEEHDYPIESSTITLSFPSSTSLVDAPELDRPFEIAADDHAFRLTTGQLHEDESVVLTAHFASGSLIQTAPAWQAAAEARAGATRRAAPLALGAGFIGLAIGGLALWTDARSHRRDLHPQRYPPTPTPPADLPAAVVSKLLGQGAGFLGTLFDLAGRGNLEIREERGRLGTRKRTLRRPLPPAGLRPHEEVLLEALFEGGKDGVDLAQTGARLARRRTRFNGALDEELVARGWVDPARQARRRWLAGIWIVAALASSGVFIAGAFWLGSALGQGADAVTWPALLTGVGGGAMLAAVAGLAYAAGFSTLSPEGAEQAGRWKAFKSYLESVSRGKEPAIRPDFFERYLPYAAAFGLGKPWAKFFQKLGGVPLPAWFHAVDASQADFGAIVAVMAASDSSAASAGAGAAGAAGASGGGASGAG